MRCCRTKSVGGLGLSCFTRALLFTHTVQERLATPLRNDGRVPAYRLQLARGYQVHTSDDNVSSQSADGSNRRATNERRLLVEAMREVHPAKTLRGSSTCPPEVQCGISTGLDIRIRVMLHASRAFTHAQRLTMQSTSYTCYTCYTCTSYSSYSSYSSFNRRPVTTLWWWLKIFFFPPQCDTYVPL